MNTSSTTTATIEITCPEWCEIDPQEHASELGNWDGACLHRGAETVVKDPIGWRQDVLDDKDKRCHPVTVSLSSATGPEGREGSSPFVWVDGHDLTIAQAEALAAEILRQVQLYHASYGDGFDENMRRWDEKRAEG